MFEEWVEYEAFRPLLEDVVACPDCGIGVLEQLDNETLCCYRYVPMLSITS